MQSTQILEASAPFVATPRQNELASAWADPGCSRLLASGAIRSGKTQAASRLLVETALRYPSQYLVARATYRALRDTTQRALLHGDGPLPPLIPREAMLGQSLATAYRASDDQVTLANGATIVFRSLEENAVEKIRGLTLGGALVDQAEEFRYEDGERLYDELLGRLSDSRGPQKLLLIANPAGLDHWVYRRFIAQPDLDDTGRQIARVVHFTMLDNAANLPVEYVSQMVGAKETRPGWYRTFVLGEWGAIEDAAYQIEPAHLIEGFRLEDAFERFEAADYGLNGAPWCLWVADYEGNLIAYDLLYEKNKLPSDLAPLIFAKREESWGPSWAAYIDPAVWHRTGQRNKWGAPAMLADEFIENGIQLEPANNDPRAGLLRMRELLKLDPEHQFPSWHPRAGEFGAPRIYFTRACERVVSELRSAPLQPLGKIDGGEKVDPEWESRNGHAAAMCRYAVMTRPDASDEPKPQETDMRRVAMQAALEPRASGSSRAPSRSSYMG